MALIFSLIFLLSLELYLRLEEIANTELGLTAVFLTVLEEKINFLNDWIFKHRLACGILFVLLSLHNIKSLIFL
ncbi:MAG: hypothetical protein PHS93_06755 [Candidatus Omnitrophica bacterium]|nr:hypothetical protein [Candidatus Omnitrophota bacterium]